MKASNSHLPQSPQVHLQASMALSYLSLSSWPPLIVCIGTSFRSMFDHFVVLRQLNVGTRLKPCLD